MDHCSAVLPCVQNVNGKRRVEVVLITWSHFCVSSRVLPLAELTLVTWPFYTGSLVPDPLFSDVRVSYKNSVVLMKTLR